MVEGRNVYGILRAGRAQSTESIVLSAPYLLEDADNAHGVAILLSLTKYFQGRTSHRHSNWSPHLFLCS